MHVEHGNAVLVLQCVEVLVLRIGGLEPGDFLEEILGFLHAATARTASAQLIGHGYRASQMTVREIP